MRDAIVLERSFRRGEALGSHLAVRGWWAPVAACLLCLLKGQVGAGLYPYAYVTTEARDTLVTIDIESDQVISETPLSLGSSDVAVTPDGHLAYVVNANTNSVTVIDLHSLTAIGSIPVGTAPARIAIAPDGQFAYVTGSPTVAIEIATGAVSPVLDNVNVYDLTISPDAHRVYFAVIDTLQTPAVGLIVFDTITHALRQAAPNYMAEAVALSPAGQFIYLVASNLGSAVPRLLVLDADSLDVVMNLVLDFGPAFFSGVAVTPEGSTVYVTDGEGLGTYVIDAATGEMRRTQHDLLRSNRFAMMPSGKTMYVNGVVPGTVALLDTTTQATRGFVFLGTTDPFGIALSADGTVLYAAAADAFYVIDTSKNKVISSLPSGSDPTGIAATADGRFVYTTNQASGNVTVFDTDQRSVIKSIQTGGNPVGIALTPDGQRAYVASFGANGMVFVLDTASNAKIASIQVPPEANGVAVTPDGKRVFVSSQIAGVISAIDVQTNTIMYQFGIAYDPKDIAISRDGSFALVGTESPAAVQFFDPTRLTLTSSPFVGSLNLSNRASAPCAIVLNSDSSRAYTTDVNGSSVYSIDTTRQSLITATDVAVPYSTNSCGIALSPDDSRVYVANNANNVVTVLDTSDLHVLHHIPVPPLPYDLVITCPGGCPSPIPASTATPSAIPTTALTPTPTPTALPCAGDCNGDGRITVDELLTGVSIVLGEVPPASCPSLDVNGDGGVTIDELLVAIAEALNGCPSSP